MLDCFTGGKQLNFFKNLNGAFAEYTVSIPTAGVYELTLRTAAVNRDQTFTVLLDNDPKKKLGTVIVPQSYGAWATTEPIELKLSAGEQKIAIAQPYERGIAVRWLELKKK